MKENKNSAFDDFGGETLTEELEGTWLKRKGAEIVGTISHAYAWDEKDRGMATGRKLYGVAVRLSSPTMCNVDGLEEELPIDSLVGVTLNSKLNDLLYLRPGDKVAIRCEGQVDLRGGRTTWKFTCRYKGVRQVTTMIPVEQPEAASEEPEVTPF